MANTVNLTHTGQQLDSAITTILSRQIDADEIDVLIVDIPTDTVITTGSVGGWLEPYMISGVI